MNRDQTRETSVKPFAILNAVHQIIESLRMAHSSHAERPDVYRALPILRRACQLHFNQIAKRQAVAIGLQSTGILSVNYV